MNNEEFAFDVFLSHSSKDKAVVRGIAERLRADGVRVWTDDDRRPEEVEEGLERSRVLVLCMSADAFGAEWAQLEAGTFRFRDPLNKERRFIPLRLDEAPIGGSLGQLPYISWLPGEREQGYGKLLEACRLAARPAEQRFQLDTEGFIWSYAFSPDGKRALSAGYETVQLWDVETGHCLRVFEGHRDEVRSVCWSADQRCALSGSIDETVRMWDVKTGHCKRVFVSTRGGVLSAALSADRARVLAGSFAVSLWDVATGERLRVLEGNRRCQFWSVAWSGDERHALSGGSDRTVRLWDMERGRCLRVLEGHSGYVYSVAWSGDGHRALSAAGDETVRLWDLETGRCLRVLEGHRGIVRTVAWSADQRDAVSGGWDRSVRLWDVETGRCLCDLKGHAGEIRSVAWSADQRHALSGDDQGGVRVWDLSEFVSGTGPVHQC